MDQKAIGEYLKRLRIRYKYTQSDLGARIGVTDKAISRWESGLGMPEISNLMELAKLYGVSVDDILNLNEGVFCSPETEPEAASAPENTARSESADEIESGEKTAEGEQEKSNKLITPSRKFRVILLFAYFVFGTLIVAGVSIHNDSAFTALYIVLALSIIASAVMSFFKMPRLVGFIVNVALWTADAVMTFVLILIVAGRAHGDVYRTSAVFGGVVFVLLLVMQGLYEAVDFVKSPKIKKRLNYSVVGAAFSILALAVTACANFGMSPHDRYGYISLALVFTGVSAIAFALSHIYSKWINIITVVCGIPCGVINIFSIILGDIIINDTVFEVYDIFTVNNVIGILIIAIAGIMIGWFFEGHKPSLTANRIVSAITVLSVIPVFAFTVESFAVNAVFGSSALIAAGMVRIAVLVAVVVYCVKLFRPVLFIRTMRKGEKTK